MKPIARRTLLRGLGTAMALPWLDAMAPATNFAARAIFTPRDQAEAEEYSRILGNETVKAKSVSRSSGKGSSRSQSTSDQKRALMYDSEIKQMPMDKCILDMAAARPIYADKIRYYDDPAFKQRAGMDIPFIPDLHF